MKFASGLSLRGRIKVTLYDNAKDKDKLLESHRQYSKRPSGVLVVDKKNLIVNTGLLNVTHLLAGDPEASSLRYMSFGSGGYNYSGGAVVDPLRSNYQLNTEEFREPLVYKLNDGSPNYSVTLTGVAIASEHPTVTSLSEVGLQTKSVPGTPTSSTMDLFAHVSFPEVFFSSTAPVSTGLVVDWEIIFDAV